MFGQAQLKVPVIGLVENMSYYIPPGAATELQENKFYIFGKDGGKKLADEFDIPLLGQVPLIQSIREGGDEGIPIMAGNDHIAKQAFSEFAASAVRGIAMRNANIPATEIQEVLE